ncbi:MAG: di-heme oxidoredictase family protein [Opitutaceae bacterium]
MKSKIRLGWFCLVINVAPVFAGSVIVTTPPLRGLGSPLRELTNKQLSAFVDGRASFSSTETVADGIGPIFNDTSCVACHDAGGVGGASARTVTRFGRNVNGVFDPMDAQGGSLLQERAIDPAVREVVPKEATVIARRLTTPLYGAGLIEAINPLEILLGTVRPKPAGIKGKVALVKDVVSGNFMLGRFGWKAQVATLLAFAGDAYVNEMGITNRYFPTENAPNGNKALLARFDKVADVEDKINPVDGKADIDRLADFMRLLAPPEQLELRSDAAEAGQRLFSKLECSACHVASMTTIPNKIEALSEKKVMLYSDLLLHDMGALGDGIEQGSAGVRDMRTAPLWGLRSRPAYLHDGRAATVEAAILAHDGEAANARKLYAAATAAERSALLEFLKTL